MKKLLTLLLVMGLALALVPVSSAQEVATFDITAYLPAATGVVIKATRVVASNDDFLNTVTSFDFGTLSPINGVFLSDYYFAVDVGVTAGAGSTNITLTYEEGLPLIAGNSLGYKTTADFVAITGGPGPEDQTETPIATSLGTKTLLIDLEDPGVSIAPSDLGGGFFRAYIGIYPGGDASLPDGMPFTAGDEADTTYHGTLIVSATLA
jgi:hypothetical protein